MRPLSDRECHLLPDHYWSPLSVDCIKETDGWDLQLLTPAHCNNLPNTPENWHNTSLSHCSKTRKHIKTTQQTKHNKSKVLKMKQTNGIPFCHGHNGSVRMLTQGINIWCPRNFYTISYLRILYICDCKLHVLKVDFYWCRVEEERWLSSTSQESAEFDTQTKSSLFPLKGFQWHVKQQTESQCDCLSNEKITALHLTENDLEHKDWVNKKLLLQMGDWHAGACADTGTANVL